LINTSAQVGGALGLAVIATLSATRAENLIAGGEPTASALTSGYHLAFGVGAALLIVSLVIAVTVLQQIKMPAHGHETSGEAALSEAG
jgi:hypothetical protein